MPIYPESNFNPAWQSQWRGVQRGVDRALSSAPTEVIRSGGSTGRRGKTPEQIQRDAEAIAGQAQQQSQAMQEYENARRLVGILPQLREMYPEQAEKLLQFGEHLNSVLNQYESAQQGVTGQQQGGGGAGGTPHYPTAGSPGRPPQYAIPEGGIPLPGGISRTSGIHAVEKPGGGYKLTNVGKQRTDVPQRGVPGGDQVFQQVMAGAVNALQEKAGKEGQVTEKDLLEQAAKSYAEVVKVTPMNQEPPDWGTFYADFTQAVQGGGVPGGGGGGGIPTPAQARTASYQPGAGPGSADLYSQGQPQRTPAPEQSNLMWATDTEGRRILVPRMDQFNFGEENAGAPGIPQEKRPAKKPAGKKKPKPRRAKKPTLRAGETRYGRRQDGTPVAVGNIVRQPGIPASMGGQGFQGPGAQPQTQVAGIPTSMAGPMEPPGRTMDYRPGDQPPEPRTMDARGGESMARFDPTPYREAYPASGRGVRGAANLVSGAYGGLLDLQEKTRQAARGTLDDAGGQAVASPPPPGQVAPPTMDTAPGGTGNDPWSPQVVRRGVDRQTGDYVYQLSDGRVIDALGNVIQ